MLTQYNGQYVVLGIASYVRDCNTLGSDNLPNVFARVSAYNNWIKSIVEET